MPNPADADGLISVYVGSGKARMTAGRMLDMVVSSDGNVSVIRDHYP